MEDSVEKNLFGQMNYFIFLTFLIKVNNYIVNVPPNINKIKRRPLLAMAVQYIHSVSEIIKILYGSKVFYQN